MAQEIETEEGLRRASVGLVWLLVSPDLQLITTLGKPSIKNNIYFRAILSPEVTYLASTWKYLDVPSH